MRWIQWISDRGYNVTFSDTLPYLMESFDPGTMTATPEQIMAIRTDGVDTAFVSLNARAINLVGTVTGIGSHQLDAHTVLDRRRQELARAFHPKHFGTLIWHNEAGVYRIRCRPVSSPVFKDPVEAGLTVDIEFHADKPYWQSAELFSLTLGKVVKLWRFPWTIPTVFSSFVDVGSIQNDTGEDIYPVLRVSPTNSDLVVVRNESTRKELILTHSIEAGQTLVIDMEDYTTVLTSSDGSMDVSHWVEGDYWSIGPGENRIRISTETPSYTPDTVIEWRVPIVGV